jgi:K(+)-stimulated pyrophosphate-energized sodium pump
VNGTALFGAIAAGLIVGVIIGKLTEYYTSTETKPAQNIAEQSQTGSATNIIHGLATGMESVALPVLMICIGIFVAYELGGVYGVALAAVGMLSTLGISLGIDAYGPVADNAGGLAEMAELEPEVRERTDALDAVGNTTAAIGKGFAIGSAALTALALFNAFSTRAGKILAENGETGDLIDSANSLVLNINSTDVILGLLIGGFLPFLFSALTMRAVGKAANEMVNEIRRQFREIPGLLEGKASPDAARCVAISTDGSLKQMIVPGVMAVAAPILIGLWSIQALGGMLAGALVTGVMMAIFMANAGGAWDNAKKYIEGGKFGGKGSEAHKAAVVGDTVGDPFKDTSGPSLNILDQADDGGGPGLPALVRAIVERFKGTVAEHGGEVQQYEHLGRRELAYPIDKQTNGDDHFLKFTADNTLVVEADRDMRLDERVLRHLIVVDEDWAERNRVSQAKRGKVGADGASEED